MSPDTKKPRRFKPDRDVKEWKGAYVPYDILKEAFVAFLAVAVLIVLLAVVFSSPDDPAITLKTWSANSPVDFAQTAITELDGTRAEPPPTDPRTTRRLTRRSTSASSSPTQWFGVHQPIDTAQDFVIGPLRTLPNQPVTQAALNVYRARRRHSKLRGPPPTRRRSRTQWTSTAGSTSLPGATARSA